MTESTQDNQSLNSKFADKNGLVSLLTNDDPPPFSLKKGKSIFMFTSPHDGIAVPKTLPNYLGMDREWFNDAHEARDLNMNALFKNMQYHFSDSSFLSGNYSRLVTDLNRYPEHGMTRTSSEYAEISIKANQQEQCDTTQEMQRIEEVHTPYHNARHERITQIREEHQGVIVIDMHTFNPTWKGKARDVEMGTLRAEETPLSHALEEFLHNQSEYRFILGEPYNVADLPEFAATMISDRSDVQYIGIEIRSDLVDNPEKREKMCDFLERCVTHLQTHPNYEAIIANRSEISGNTPTKQHNDGLAL